MTSQTVLSTLSYLLLTIERSESTHKCSEVVIIVPKLSPTDLSSPDVRTCPCNGVWSSRGDQMTPCSERGRASVAEIPVGGGEGGVGGEGRRGEGE